MTKVYKLRDIKTGKFYLGMSYDVTEEQYGKLYRRERDAKSALTRQRKLKKFYPSIAREFVIVEFEMREVRTIS